MKPPKLVPVESSNLQSVGFENGLWVRFKGGGLYHYPEVPREVFDKMGEGDSAGRWFTFNIRGKFKHVAVDDA